MQTYAKTHRSKRDIIHSSIFIPFSRVCAVRRTSCETCFTLLKLCSFRCHHFLFIKKNTHTHFTLRRRGSYETVTFFLFVGIARVFNVFPRVAVVVLKSQCWAGAIWPFCSWDCHIHYALFVYIYALCLHMRNVCTNCGDISLTAQRSCNNLHR